MSFGRGQRLLLVRESGYADGCNRALTYVTLSVRINLSRDTFVADIACICWQNSTLSDMIWYLILIRFGYGI